MVWDEGWHRRDCPRRQGRPVLGFRTVPRRPVLAADGWCCIGIRLGTVWADPIWAGTYHAGHLFMYELRERQLNRREYKALDAGIQQMSGTVSTLSRTARDAMLRAATLWRA
jgi:hypothetical protein